MHQAQVTMYSTHGNPCPPADPVRTALPSCRPQSTPSHPTNAFPQQHILVVQHPFVLQQTDTSELPLDHTPCSSLSGTAPGQVPLSSWRSISEALSQPSTGERARQSCPCTEGPVLLPTACITLGTALAKTMPLLRVMGCWLCRRCWMSSGMVGKLSPSSRNMSCREGGERL